MTGDSPVIDPSAGVHRACMFLMVGAVRAQVGAVASFRVAGVAEALPKTRSGKTLRGIIQSVADGVPYTLPGTIEDATAVDKVKAALQTIDYPRNIPRKAL